LSEELIRRAEKYIEGTVRALECVEITCDVLPIRPEDVKRVIDAIQRYASDAKHFLAVGDPATGLSSICYAEGLLDGLRLLKLIRIQE